MHSFKAFIPSIPHWSLIGLASAVGIAAASFRTFESEDSKKKRRELKKQRELSLLAQRIAAYAQTVHQQFPTGDVVVSERDLAEQLRKRPESVVTALNLLLNEQKVQRAPLNGYWKLNS
jgi:flagellar biosynthesis component FlhA